MINQRILKRLSYNQWSCKEKLEASLCQADFRPGLSTQTPCEAALRAAKLPLPATLRANVRL